MRRSLLIAVLVAAGCGDNMPGQPDAQFDPWVLDELTAEQGFWVRTPEFDVPAGTETQDCYFFQVPDLAGGEDLWIDRVQLGLNPGSHHMNVFRVRTIMALDPANAEPIDLGGVQGSVIRGADDVECWKSSNWADWPLVDNSQASSFETPVLDWALPEGVAQRFTPGETLMLQVHFVNATTQTTPYRGRAGIDFWRSQDGDTIELGTLFATQQSIRICQSNPEPTYQGTCTLPAGVHTVVAANGHFHSRGRDFRIFHWDGISTDEPVAADQFYESQNWGEPVMDTDLDVDLPSGGGIWWTCQYEWTAPEPGCDALNEADPQQAGDCCYTFGPRVETNEHCNVFVYYYPREDRTDITCF